MTEYVDVCALSDIPVEGVISVTVGDVDVALVRTADTVYAITDACSHADVALSEGEVSGCFLECWLHGSQFDLRTGRPTSPPAIDPVPIYPTRIVEASGEARVEVGTTPLSTSDIDNAIHN